MKNIYIIGGTMGVGKTAVCPSSEWFVQTDCAKGFYETIGFKQNTEDVFLVIPCKWF